eukprot:2561798-Pyramimonas_sp.AAC.1
MSQDVLLSPWAGAAFTAMCKSAADEVGRSRGLRRLTSHVSPRPPAAPVRCGRAAGGRSARRAQRRVRQLASHPRARAKPLFLELFSGQQGLARALQRR